MSDFILIEAPCCPRCGGSLDSLGRCDTCDYGWDD